MCDWIEAHGERYEGFVEDEGEESDGGRGKRRGKAGKTKESPGKDAGTAGPSGPSKRLQAYLRGMRENGECTIFSCGVGIGAKLWATRGACCLRCYVGLSVHGGIRAYFSLS